MKPGLLSLAALLIPLLFAGCALLTERIDAPLPPLAPGQARIIAYRTAALGAMEPPAVLANGSEIGRAAVRGYFHAELPPGQYTLEVADERSLKLDLPLEAGRVYYVSLSVSILHGLPRFEPEVVNEATAKKALENCHLVEKKAEAAQTKTEAGQAQPATGTDEQRNWLGLKPSKSEPYRRH